MSPVRQREFIRHQQEVNAGLAASEAAYAQKQHDLAMRGGNRLVARREGQEAEIAEQFADWRRNDAVTGVPAPRRHPRPPR